MDEERKAGRLAKPPGVRKDRAAKKPDLPTLADQGIDKNLPDRARKAVATGKAQFAKLNGHDPVAYIVSSNVERRSLTAGQKAIATALIYPETKRGRPETHSGQASDRTLCRSRSVPIAKSSAPPPTTHAVT